MSYSVSTSDNRSAREQLSKGVGASRQTVNTSIEGTVNIISSNIQNTLSSTRDTINHDVSAARTVTHLNVNNADTKTPQQRRPNPKEKAERKAEKMKLKDQAKASQSKTMPPSASSLPRDQDRTLRKDVAAGRASKQEKEIFSPVRLNLSVDPVHSPVLAQPVGLSQPLNHIQESVLVPPVGINLSIDPVHSPVLAQPVGLAHPFNHIQESVLAQPVGLNPPAHSVQSKVSASEQETQYITLRPKESGRLKRKTWPGMLERSDLSFAPKTEPSPSVDSLYSPNLAEPLLLDLKKNKVSSFCNLACCTTVSAFAAAFFGIGLIACGIALAVPAIIIGGVCITLVSVIALARLGMRRRLKHQVESFA